MIARATSTDSRATLQATRATASKPTNGAVLEIRVPDLVVLAVAALLAGAAEYLVTLRPHLFDIPPPLSAVLQPMWPHTDAVLVAIVLFVAAAVTFTAAISGSAPGKYGDAPVYVKRNPAGVPSRPTLVGLTVASLLWAWVIVQLYGQPTDLSLPGLFAVGLVLFVGSLIYHEWGYLVPPRARWRITPSALLDLLWVAAFVSLFTFLQVFDINNWYYSSIGDEHAFFLFAKELALGDKGHSLFAQDGAYGIIPVLGSAFEAAQMHVFGINGFGWKLATVTPAILTLVATYGLARSLLNRRVALLGVAFLATSHYLLAYGHSGYPNLEPLLPGVLAPLLFVLGIRRSSIVLLLASGIVAGLGWYTYYTSRVAIVVLSLATIIMVRRQAWISAAAPVVVGFIFMVLPLFAASKFDVLAKMFEQTGSGTTTEVAANRGLLPVWNVGRTLLAFNYNTHDGIWLSGSLLDPLAGALYVMGVACAIASWRSAAQRQLLAWLAVGLLITGVLSKYDYVSVSRLNYMLPITVILAAIAADRMARTLENFSPRSVSRYVFPALLVGCAALAGWGNLQRWFVVTPENVPTSATSVAIRIIEDPRCQRAPMPPVVVDVGIGGAILPALEASAPSVMPQFGLYQDPPRWADTADSRCVIFRAPQDSEAQQLQTQLASQWPAAIAVQECDRSGIVRLIAYYPSISGASNEPSLACRSRSP